MIRTLNHSRFPAEGTDRMTKTGTPQAPARNKRLAEELRANLQRRKAQARSRRTGDADERPDGLGAERDSTHFHEEHAGRESES